MVKDVYKVLLILVVIYSDMFYKFVISLLNLYLFFILLMIY